MRQNTFKADIPSDARQIIEAMKFTLLLKKMAFPPVPQLWVTCPTYNVPVHVTGDDTVIQFSDHYLSVVHPIGRNIKSGTMSAQYDVRLPAYWIYDKMEFEFGGATMASASTASAPVRFNGHSAIRTGFSRGGWSSGSGGNYSKAAAWFDRGAAQGGEMSQMFTYTWGQELYVGTGVRLQCALDSRKDRGGRVETQV